MEVDMDVETFTETVPSYDTDVAGWAHGQARLLREGRFSELDIENIAEEIDSVGRSEQKELTNRLKVLLCHLLKWKFQPKKSGSSWKDTIWTQRRQIERHMRRNPSLKAIVNEAIQDGYADARVEARIETGLEPDVFPVECPFTWAEITDPDFLPE